MRSGKSGFRARFGVRAFGRTITVLGLLGGATLVAAPAHGTAPVAPVAPADAATATAVAARVGDRTAGAYFDVGRRHMVVTVTDERAAATVRGVGAVAHRVDRGQVQLRQIAGQLASQVRIPGVAWAVDPPSGQMVVSYDTTVTGPALDTLTTVVRRLGRAARMKSVDGVFSLTLAGGDAVHSTAGRCSVGFNVRRGSDDFFLTAGHCAAAAATWYTDQAQSVVAGKLVASSFPDNDYALFSYLGAGSGVPRDGTVNLYNGRFQDITSAGEVHVGQLVSRSGSTTHLTTGRVTAVNATISYSTGLVHGLIQTDMCAELGDSGGALFADSTALGLTSGGVGTCAAGGTTYYQPVTEALAAFGVRVF